MFLEYKEIQRDLGACEPEIVSFKTLMIMDSKQIEINAYSTIGLCRKE